MPVACGMSHKHAAQELTAMGPDREIALNERVTDPVLSEKIRDYLDSYAKGGCAERAERPVGAAGARRSRADRRCPGRADEHRGTGGSAVRAAAGRLAHASSRETARIGTADGPVRTRSYARRTEARAHPAGAPPGG